jgi:hypothetical protein
MNCSKLLAAALGMTGTFDAGVAMFADGLPRVVSVSPSGMEVPANLLRISIRFDGAPEGQVLRRLSLATQDGTPLLEPFLDQELWSPDGRVLTVLLHPGRVKTGLIAHEQLGAILTEGETVQLMLDGQALWRWVVGPRDEQGPCPDGWRLSSVRSGHRDPLVVRLDGPIDGQEAGYVAVVDARHRRVAGRPELLESERVWRFTPAEAWSAGPYQLVARGTLEDSAGNRLNSRFERDVEQPPEPAADVAIPLGVAPRR